MFTIDKEKRDKIVGVAQTVGGTVASIAVGAFVGVCGKALIGNTSGLTKVGAGIGLWIAGNALGQLSATYVEDQIAEGAELIDQAVTVANMVEGAKNNVVKYDDIFEGEAVEQ